MSDLRPKSKQVRNDHTGGDLRLSVIQRGFPQYTHRQIQRWAESKDIPGAYRLKRGAGHWRVRDCPAFRKWWDAKAKIPLAWATKGYDTNRMLKDMGRRLPRDLFTKLCKLKKEMPVIHRLLMVIGLKTRTGVRGYLDKHPHPWWWAPTKNLPNDFVQWARTGTDDALIIASAVGDLMARGIPPNVKTVADFLNISTATFYRRGYNRHFQKCLCVFGEDAPTLEKDSRAERLYKDQVLQETQFEP